MKKYKSFIACLIISLGALTSSCATGLIENMHGPKPLKYEEEQKSKVFSDQIISYGIPATEIKNHEYAIAMAGQNYSYLIQPADPGKKTLFRDYFNQLDTRYLAFTTPDNSMNGKTQAKSVEKMSFNIQDNQIYQMLQFVYIKPSKDVKAGELEKLEKSQLSCRTEEIEKKSYLVCNQRLQVVLTVATKARNTDQLSQKFRTPLTFDFYKVSTKKRYNLKKAVLLPFYPIAITYDIISIPALLGLASIGIEGPADKAFEGFFKF